MNPFLRRMAMGAILVFALFGTGLALAGAPPAARPRPEAPLPTACPQLVAPAAADAFAHLVPCNFVVTEGTSFTLDLRISSGTNQVVGQQSYLTFPATLLQVVDPTGGCGHPVTSLQSDTAAFEVVLQNTVNNGTGEIAYASGTFGSGQPPGADFRVARITFCAVAAGSAGIHFQFLAPNRISRITDPTSTTVSNPALYQDCTVTILPAVTATATLTPTPPPPTLTPTPLPNRPPLFLAPSPPNGTTFILNAGNNLSFAIRAGDPDAGDSVTLGITGLPAGASFPIPPPANPVQSTFSWTPTNAAAGPHSITFSATDSHGASVSLAVTIIVVPRSPTPTPSNTPSSTPSNTPAPPTNTPTNTPTETAVVPSNTPTNTPTNTAVVPTNTATNTPTNTAVVPTNTATNTPTNTAVIPTNTATNTPTNTAVVPTNTATNTPTNTAVVPTSTPTNTPTNTAIVPSNTATNTPTNTAVVPTNTATNTPTNTAVVPTNTATNTPTNTAVVPSNTPSNTPTNTAVVPTRTLTSTPTRTRVPPTATRTPVTCSVCNVYIADVNISCNPDGSVHWDAVVRNNAACTVFSPWRADLQQQRNYGDHWPVVDTQTGKGVFPPGDSHVSGDFPARTFPADTTFIRVRFRLTSDEVACNPDPYSPMIEPCRVPAPVR